MALHTSNNNSQPQVDTNLSTQGLTNNGVTNSVGSSTGYSLEFGSGINGLMSANQGSDYTLGVAKVLSNIYEGSNRKVKPKVHILDKETFTNLAYSTVVVTLKQQDTVNYFIVLLEETGRKPLTASEVISEWETSMKVPGATPMIYTADDAINNILHSEIITALQSEYGKVEFQSVDGIVLHKGHPSLDQIGPMLATIAYNACYVEAQLGEAGIKDLNIELTVQNQKNKQLRFESNMSKAIAVNEVGQPVRTDWRLDLCLVNINTSNRLVLNEQNAKAIISRVGGYIDAIPEQVNLMTVPGQQPQVGIRFRPQIVITSNSSEAPTTGYMLLGLASSLVMANKNMWLAALQPKDKKVNVGSLNIMSKIDEGEGQRIDFTSKNYSLQQVYAGISSMFSLDPVVSVDIESFGPQSFYQSVLSAAASPRQSTEKAAAAKVIIETANWLTNGRFPMNFDPNRIFASEGVVIPMGTWSDKTGDRDLREIDLTFLASHTDDMTLLNKWTLSSLPMSVSGFDPYIAKVDIINKLVPTAEITGKAVRVTFTAEFINTLSASIVSAGLNVRYEPEIKFTEDTNLSIMSSYLGNAGIGNNTAGFAREAVQAGPSYQTGYTLNGYNRWN